VNILEQWVFRVGNLKCFCLIGRQDFRCSVLIELSEQAIE
jgi:hypothetical protein